MTVIIFTFGLKAQKKLKSKAWVAGHLNRPGQRKKVSKQNGVEALYGDCNTIIILFIYFIIISQFWLVNFNLHIGLRSRHSSLLLT